jgi:uncharacterized protein YbjQ (UPF0145 family)
MAFTYRKSGLLLTTTPSLDGHDIVEYQGLVVGEAIIGANIFRDLFASIRDIVGGRSGAYENALNDTREIALGEMTEHAQQLGANAIIGIDLDYETINRMLMVCVSGTAVIIRRK